MASVSSIKPNALASPPPSYFEPRKVWDDPDLVCCKILIYLSAKDAANFAACSHTQRRIVAEGVDPDSAGSYRDDAKKRRYELLFNSCILSPTTTDLSERTRIASPCFQSPQTSFIPSKDCAIMKLSSDSKKALLAMQNQPIEGVEVLCLIANGGDLDLLEAALNAMKQRSGSQPTLDSLVSMCKKAIQKNHTQVAQRLLTIIAERHAPPAVVIDWRDLLEEVSAVGNAVLVQDILKKAETNAGRISQAGLNNALEAAARYNHLESIDRLLQTSVAGGVSQVGLNNALVKAAGQNHLESIDRLKKRLGTIAPKISTASLQTSVAGGVSQDGLSMALEAAAAFNHLENIDHLHKKSVRQKTTACFVRCWNPLKAGNEALHKLHDRLDNHPTFSAIAIASIIFYAGSILKN